MLCGWRAASSEFLLPPWRKTNLSTTGKTISGQIEKGHDAVLRAARNKNFLEKENVKSHYFSCTFFFDDYWRMEDGMGIAGGVDSSRFEKTTFKRS